MKEPALILLKPDCLYKSLVGNVLSRLAEIRLEIIAARMVKVTKKLAEEHYCHLKKKPFFGEMIRYMLGEFHEGKNILALIYYGEGAVKKCRQLAGATNPEEAAPTSIRGSFGRITTKGVFENVIHVSGSPVEAEREIKTWFHPDEILSNIYPTKIKKVDIYQKRIWA